MIDAGTQQDAGFELEARLHQRRALRVIDGQVLVQEGLRRGPFEKLADPKSPRQFRFLESEFLLGAHDLEDHRGRRSRELDLGLVKAKKERIAGVARSGRRICALVVRRRSIPLLTWLLWFCE